MSRLVKIVDNKYVQIEEHKSPNICFNTNEYDDFEDYCTLRETFDPFEMFYENQGLKKQLEVGEEQYNDLVEKKEELQEQLSIKTLQLEEMKLSKRDYTQENILEAEKEQLNRLVNSCQEEIRKLKKQLEEERNKVREYSYKLSNFRCEETYENQQKEFIELLEKEIVDSKAGSSQQYYAKEHLILFKEIIGGKDGR